MGFRLDIGERNFKHLKEFVSITKLKKGRINLRRTNLWQSKFTQDMKPNLLCKYSRKFKHIKATFDIYGTSIAFRIVENVFNTVQFLVWTVCFSSIIAAKVFLTYDSWGLWCKFYILNLCILNLYIADMILILEVALMVPSFFKES